MSSAKVPLCDESDDVGVHASRASSPTSCTPQPARVPTRRSDRTTSSAVAPKIRSSNNTSIMRTPTLLILSCLSFSLAKNEREDESQNMTLVAEDEQSPRIVCTKSLVQKCVSEGGVCITASKYCPTKTKVYASVDCDPCTCCPKEPITEPPLQCHLTSDCWKKGGSCIAKHEKCMGHPLLGLCDGIDCLCCVPEMTEEPEPDTTPAPGCQITSECWNKGGICVEKKGECMGSLQTGLCDGPDCLCCVPDEGCSPRNKCKNRGGSCKKTVCSAGEKEIANGCKGDGCWCCVPEEKCSPRNRCKKKGGTCQESPCSPDEKEITNGCTGTGCWCCAPVEVMCKIKKSCSKKGGSCKETCAEGEVLHAGGCGSKGCSCCIPETQCTIRKKCEKYGGVCKMSCSEEEHEVVKGCTGKDCLCCAPRHVGKSKNLTPH
ncbi:uncharacterized protein [Panulirus ornatus]|uniref:uncharacterized protein n=1 Tax=Panulirus ornatus TaxID=150431 RepID=UPI003A8AF93A